ncbi:MAG: hypothetical protein M1830_001301 [Pleopsidium flavum]|nr:MAG: hypothetical protein M1830_001301 [Pleopsidium flavum]
MRYYEGEVLKEGLEVGNEEHDEATIIGTWNFIWKTGEQIMEEEMSVPDHSDSEAYLTLEAGPNPNSRAGRISTEGDDGGDDSEESPNDGDTWLAGELKYFDFEGTVSCEYYPACSPELRFVAQNQYTRENLGNITIPLEFGFVEDDNGLPFIQADLDTGYTGCTPTGLTLVGKKSVEGKPKGLTDAERVRLGFEFRGSSEEEEEEEDEGW